MPFHSIPHLPGAKVVGPVLQGNCIDAVVSSVSGSNNGYNQVSTIFGDSDLLNSANLNKKYRKNSVTIQLDVGFHGLPYLEWLLAVDGNVVTLRKDAMKIAFTEV